MTDAMHRDEIIGVAFGDISAELGGVLISLQVRTRRDGIVDEGIRDPLLLHRVVLESLQENLPRLLDAISASGIDSDAIPVAARPVPWNAGPSMALAIKTGVFMCTSFGFYPPEASHLAPIAVVEVTSGLNPGAGAGGAEYYFSIPALLEFVESIPKVLRRMDQKGVRNLGALH